MTEFPTVITAITCEDGLSWKPGENDFVAGCDSKIYVRLDIHNESLDKIRDLESQIAQLLVNNRSIRVELEQHTTKLKGIERAR